MYMVLINVHNITFLLKKLIQAKYYKSHWFKKNSASIDCNALFLNPPLPLATDLTERPVLLQIVNEEGNSGSNLV